MILLGLGLALFDITKDTVFAEILVSSNIYGFLVVDWTPKWIKSANLGCVQFKPKHKSLKNFQTMCFSYWRLPVVEIATKSNNIWGCKSSKNPRWVIDAELIQKTLIIFDFTTTYGIMGFPRKKSNSGFEGILF